MGNNNRKYKLGTYGMLAAGSLIIYYVLGIFDFNIIAEYSPFLRKLCFSLFLVFVILGLDAFVEKIIAKSNEPEGTRYNLLRITHLVAIIFVLIVVIAFLFQNLYTLAVGFGVISLVLGFALQAPITSFIAWLYVVFRKPYQVGDRIEIVGMRGDVVEIHYLDTIMEECSGGYLGNDHKSGRLIHFPNSNVLKSEIINYSGHLVPFIWNETAIQVAYTSDLQFVEDCLMEAAVKDFQKRFSAQRFSKEERWIPNVYFRVNSYSWMEAVISYPVEPSDTTGRRNRILKNALPLLNAHPDKVQFPAGTSR